MSIRDSNGYFTFIEGLELKIKQLEKTALNPTSAYEATQAARVRRLQLLEIIQLANGEIPSLS